MMITLQITVENIKSINRENHHLISELTTKYYEANHSDYFFEEGDGPKLEEEPQEVEKVEEGDNDNNETVFLVAFDAKSDNDNGNDDQDNDYVLSDRDYSTDDSLPLEVTKLKKEKIKTKKETKKLRVKSKKDESVPKIDRRRKPFLNDDLNETLFTIHELSVEEQLAEIDKRQESSNFKNAVYKCIECYKGFLDEDAYNSHMFRHTKVSVFLI
jgi:hypothetical protein